MSQGDGNNLHSERSMITGVVPAASKLIKLYMLRSVHFTTSQYTQIKKKIPVCRHVSKSILT